MSASHFAHEVNSAVADTNGTKPASRIPGYGRNWNGNQRGDVDGNKKANTNADMVTFTPEANKIDMNELLSVAEAQEIAKVPRYTINYWARKGKFTCKRFGRSYAINRKSFCEFVAFLKKTDDKRYRSTHSRQKKQPNTDLFLVSWYDADQDQLGCRHYTREEDADQYARLLSSSGSKLVVMASYSHVATRNYDSPLKGAKRTTDVA